MGCTGQLQPESQSKPPEVQPRVGHPKWHLGLAAGAKALSAQPGWHMPDVYFESAQRMGNDRILRVKVGIYRQEPGVLPNTHREARFEIGL